MVKEPRRLVVPTVGVWYHVIAKKSSTVDCRAFCLCVQSDGTNPNLVHLYVRNGDDFVIQIMNSDDIKEAIWLGTNRFHLFCLHIIQEMMKAGPTWEELQNNTFFQLCFDFATQFRVFRAKDEQLAIDRTYDLVNKKLNSLLLTEKEKAQLELDHKVLINMFIASIEHHLK